MIAQNLINDHALVARIEARDEARCKSMSNSSESKKKEVCKLEKPIERINNEDMMQISIQTSGSIYGSWICTKRSNCDSRFIWFRYRSEELINYILQCIKMSFNEIKKP